MKRKAKKYWIIAGISTLAVSIIGGLAAFGLFQTQPSSNEPKKLENPQNFEYTMNVTIKDRATEHLLSWDSVNKATGYKIEITRETTDITIEKRVDKNTQEYDITDYVVSDENYTVKLTAVSDKGYFSSETEELSLKIERATAGLDFEVYDGEYEVFNGGTRELSRVVIPDTFNGSRVKKISDWGFGWNGVGLYAPQPYLESVRLPKNLEEIGEQSFRGCINLGETVIPDSVVSIGFNAFADCEKLQTQIPPNLTRIEDDTFLNCKSLKNVELPKNLTYIGAAAFQNTNFTKIVIPDSVKYIGVAAFLQMLPSGVSERGLETVEYSENLRLEFMGNSVFGGTVWYKNQPDGYIRFNDMLYRYKGEIPKNTEITSFPDGITKLARGIFENCKNLKSVILFDGLEEIFDYTFSGCTSLKSVVFPNSLKRIGVNAFRDCKALEEINLPNGLEEISEYAFGGCNGLTSIEIPDSVVSIGECAFSYCRNLERIVLSKNIEILTRGMLGGCEKLTVLEIPDSVKKIEDSLIVCTGIESIIVPKSIKEVDLYAFINEETIKAVYYEGTKVEWLEVLYFSEENEGRRPPVYYYSEAEPPLNSDGTGYDGNYWYYGADGVPKVWEYQGSE